VISEIGIDEKSGDGAIGVDTGFLTNHGVNGTSWIKGGDVAVPRTDKAVLRAHAVDVDASDCPFEINAESHGALVLACSCGGNLELRKFPVRLADEAMEKVTGILVLARDDVVVVNAVGNSALVEILTESSVGSVK
jgi:hypothetical protein